MTPSTRILLRVSGWGLVVIGFLLTFMPFDSIPTVWTWPDDAYSDGPFSAQAFAENGGSLTRAAIVAVVGVVMVVLSSKLPDKE